MMSIEIFIMFVCIIICIMFSWMLKTSFNEVEKGEEEIIDDDYKEKEKELNNKI